MEVVKYSYVVWQPPTRLLRSLVVLVRRGGCMVGCKEEATSYHCYYCALASLAATCLTRVLLLHPTTTSMVI